MKFNVMAGISQRVAALALLFASTGILSAHNPPTITSQSQPLVQRLLSGSQVSLSLQAVADPVADPDDPTHTPYQHPLLYQLVVNGVAQTDYLYASQMFPGGAYRFPAFATGEGTY